MNKIQEMFQPLGDNVLSGLAILDMSPVTGNLGSPMYMFYHEDMAKAAETIASCLGEKGFFKAGDLKGELNSPFVVYNPEGLGSFTFMSGKYAHSISTRSQSLKWLLPFLHNAYPVANGGNDDDGSQQQHPPRPSYHGFTWAFEGSEEDEGGFQVIDLGTRGQHNGLLLAGRFPDVPAICEAMSKVGDNFADFLFCTAEDLNRAIILIDVANNEFIFITQRNGERASIVLPYATAVALLEFSRNQSMIKSTEPD